jgi:hypothetical protein
VAVLEADLVLSVAVGGRTLAMRLRMAAARHRPFVCGRWPGYWVPCYLGSGCELRSSTSVNLKPANGGSAVGRTVGIDAVMAMAELAVVRRVGATAAIASCQSAGLAALFVARHESLEGVVAQVGAKMQLGQCVPVADGSLGFAAVETWVAARIAAAGTG